MHRFVQLLIVCSSAVKIKSYDRTASFEDISKNVDASFVTPLIYDVKRRNKRDLTSSVSYEKEVVIKIIEIGNWVLELDEEQDIFPSAVSEWVTDSGVNRTPAERCEFKSGHVKGMKATSTAAVSICRSGISGYFALGPQIYLVEPNNDSHIVLQILPRFKRNVKRWQFFNLTGDDTIDIGRVKVDDVDGELNENKMVHNVRNETAWHREEDFDELGYFVDYAWQPNILAYKRNGHTSSNPRRWLEIAIAVDHTVISFHGRKRVEQYVLSLMNIVNAIYQDPSLDGNIQLVISRLLLYEHRRHSVIRPGNAKKSLENVNVWNRDLHVSLPPGEARHDLAVWLTRSDIGGPSGYAPVSGVCDEERSCALNRDEGLTSAFIIAHEMAHVLGLTHDGDVKAHNDCRDEALQGSVMAPMVSSTFHQFLWSACSKKEFESKARNSHCLLNRPSTMTDIVLNATLQATFSMDEQCRMEFGEGYTLCRAFDIVEPCSHLWCGHVKSPLVCKTKKGPPLEGTECGFDKWCVNGYCEIVDKSKFKIHPVQHNPQDGGWGEWSDWGSCSRTCGTGVQFRIRKCDNPEPIYGGSDCFGSKEEWQICNSKTCPEPIRDVRAQQCTRLPRLLQLTSPRNKMVWQPYESEQVEVKCKLICISKETNEMYVTGENLMDGTPCSYENRSNICIQGTCQPLGCDQKIFSSKREDACGVCGGNNSECSIRSTQLKKKLKRDVSRIAVIPRYAREIRIEVNFSMLQDTNPTVAFVLKDRKKNSISMTIPDTSSGSNIIEGTKFYYKKIDGVNLLWAKGPVLSEIVVLVYASSTQIESGLSVSSYSEYYLHKNSTKDNSTFHWIVGGWGPCSKTCGGGRRYQTKACWDTLNSKIVPRRYCPIYHRPQVRSEKCNNFSCNFHWFPGIWETCSTTCGSFGSQSREIYCIPQSVIGDKKLTSELGTEPWKFMVEPNKCGDMKPATTIDCNRRPCPSYWKYGDWSQCSSSCGMGISLREPYCAKDDNETLYTCNEVAPKFRKFCKGPFSKLNNVLCRKRKQCFGDYSKYCSLPDLLSYCRLRPYRKLCCKSCAKNRFKNFAEE